MPPLLLDRRQLAANACPKPNRDNNLDTVASHSPPAKKLRHALHTLPEPLDRVALASRQCSPEEYTSTDQQMFQRTFFTRRNSPLKRGTG
jgi:hypothetical protein